MFRDLRVAYCRGVVAEDLSSEICTVSTGK